MVHSAREGRNDQRDEDGDVDMADAVSKASEELLISSVQGQVEVEVSETRDGTEYNEMDERDGSARTRYDISIGYGSYSL